MRPSLPRLRWRLPAVRTSAWLDRFVQNMNFFRWHIIFFCVTPCIAAAIFYGSNGRVYITYTDALFMCVSAMTVTGLNVTPLQDLTAWQQVILFILMTIGSTSSVSIVMIMVRRHFFRKKFADLVRTNTSIRKQCEDVEALHAQQHPFHPHHLYNRVMHRGVRVRASKKDRKRRKRLDASMITRVDEVARPMHHLVQDDARDPESSEGSELKIQGSSDGSPPAIADAPTVTAEPDSTADDGAPPDTKEDDDAGIADPEEKKKAGLSKVEPAQESHMSHISFDGQKLRTAHSDVPLRRRRMSESYLSARHHDKRLDKTYTYDTTSRLPRTRTIDFAEGHSPSEMRRQQLARQASREGLPVSSHSDRAPDLPRARTSSGHRHNARLTGYGGFPNPVFYGLRMLGRKAEPVLGRVATMNRTTTMQAPTGGSRDLRRTGTVYSTSGPERFARPVNYISFDAVVGRNSEFRKLTKAQEEELGGVEYRALSALLYIVISYYLGIQLISVAVLAPYLNGSHFNDRFDIPGGTGPTWFTFFNVWSAFSNNGMCLLDTSLTTFQGTYLLLFFTMFNILAGNTALPIFLRCYIWILSKVVPRDGRLHESLQFLLDHPRRCYIYLFPAYQTWFLLFVLVVLNFTDWICFLVLDINNAVLDQIPLGTRIVDGLQQALAVRAAGFAVVTLSAVAPALQVLYVIMMYIAVYPIALSIRSTNVYESKSLGLYDGDDDESEVEADFDKQGHTGSYIAYHARKQLAFDIWWLVAALWVICIIERDAIADPATDVWLNEFTVIFEIASAYGTVGLSLGTPISVTSLSGVFRNLAKIVMCAVMIRGRHRGLPNAIDRAVLLPSELSNLKSESFAHSDVERMALRARYRRASSHHFNGFPGNAEDLASEDRANDADASEWVDDTTLAPSSIPLQSDPSWQPSTSKPLEPSSSGVDVPASSSPEELKDTDREKVQ